MRNRFCVTYGIVTPESAEHGDESERGFVLASGDYEPLPDLVCGEAAERIKSDCAMPLRCALHLIGMLERDGSATAYYEHDARQNYQTGASERRAFHVPDSISESSRRRLERLMARHGYFG